MDGNAHAQISRALIRRGWGKNVVPRSLPTRPLGRLLKMFIDLQITALVAQGPDEGTEFASDGDDDLVAHEVYGQLSDGKLHPVRSCGFLTQLESFGPLR
jgi:hypothetical protein